MTLSTRLRSLLLISISLASLAPGADLIKTWTGADNNGLNNVLNWNGGVRPTFGAAANTDALLFTGAGTGIVNVNVDATAKSITISGELPYTFQGASPLRLGDTGTGTVQPNSGFFINNSTVNLALTTTGGVFFSFGRLEAAAGPISVGSGSFIDIGNGAATAGRNLTVGGAFDVTVSSLISGLGTQTSAGGHLIKEGAAALSLNGSSAGWNGRIFVNEGTLRINRATSLGSAVGDTVLAGGASTGKIELSGSIAVDETLVIAGRDSATAPVVVNLSGNNILGSPLSLNAGGNEFAIESKEGTLSVLGQVGYGTFSGAANLHLIGAGNGTLAGVVGAGGNALNVIKDGVGAWTLSGANAFTGAIHVNTGRLNLTTAHLAQNAVTVANGASLGVAVTATGQSVNATSVNLSGSTGTALTFDLGASGNPSVPVLKTSSLTVTGVVGVALKGGSVGIGQIPLIDYEGSIGGDGFAGLALTELPARLTAALVDDVANTQVLLNVTGFDIPRWTGEVDAIWDVNDGTGTGTTNWKERTSGTLTRYLQSASSTDSVIFDDTATGTTHIVLSTALSPVSVVVENAVKDYTFSGAGHLEGTGSLVKKGVGHLVLLNSTPNTFSGSVTIAGGTVRVGDGLTGLAGSLGTGPVANAGILILNRPDAYTFAGAISGDGTLIKQGAGITTLSGNSSFTSVVNVNEGTLKLGNANALGDTDGGVLVADGAALDVGGQLLPLGEVISVIGHGVSGSGAVINTGTGGAAVGPKNLVFTGPASIGGSARWDVRDNAGGVNVNGYDLIKTGSNTIQWYNIGETHLGNLKITGSGSRLTFGGNTTTGDRPGSITIEAGAQLGVEDSTVPLTKTIHTESGTINATGGVTNVIAGTIHVTTGVTINSAAAAEVVIAGKITGSGSLVKTTNGIVKITNDNNDYTGTTTISTGAFWIGDDGPTGKLPGGDIIDNGNLIFRRSGAPLVVAQNISGTGQITLPNTLPDSNDYVVTLTGNNSFNGNVTLRRAFLKITNSTALGATLPPATEGDPAPTKLVDISTARRPTLILDGSAGDIVLSPTIQFTTSSDGPSGAILNEAGNNVINGLIDLTNGGGGNTRINVTGGTLTLNGTVRSAAAATSARTLILDGNATTGVVNGVLATGGPFALTLSKLGTGTWVLNAANTYTGATTIGAGTLKLGPAGSFAASPTLDLVAGATLDVSEVAGGLSLANAQSLRGAGAVTGSVVVSPGTSVNPGPGAVAGTLAISQNLTFNGGRLLASLTNVSTEGAGINDLVSAGGDLAITAPSTIDLVSTGTLLNGSYRLINYSGALTGNVASLTLVNPTRYALVLDTSTPGQVNLLVGGAIANLVWSGDGTTNTWSQTTPNSWNAGVDTFFQSDAVTFDDSAPGTNTTVTLTGTLTPSSVVVNAAQNYTFGGAGVIGGVTGLTKSGAGTLTLNTAHTFTGKVKISGGSIVLGSAGRLNGTRWIEVDQGAVLDVHAITAGFTLGGTIVDQRVISGRGTLNGSYIVNSAGVIKPGDSSVASDLLTAGDGIGSLTFGGNLTLTGAALPGSPRAVLRIAGPTGQVVDPLNSASVAAFGSTLPTLHDHLFVTGTLALDAGSTIRIELSEGYTPALGDVFNLADWALLNTDANADSTGFDPLLATDLELPVLPAGLYWNRGLFATDGLLFISPEPPLIGAIQITPGSTVNPGVEVTFSSAVTGLEPYTYQWKRNNVAIANATGATLTLTATEADEASYTLVVTNPAGSSTSSPATLVVNDPVQISAQPQSRTFNPGAEVTFSVEATGTAPFTYQWRKNGLAIENETSDSLTLSSITEADQAAYDVVVTNGVGSKVSNVATLSVNDPVVFIRQPSAQGAVVGGNASFSVEVTGSGTFTYQWGKNGVDLQGAAATQAALVLNNVTEDFEGVYSVRVTNLVGAVISTGAPLVVAGDSPKVVSLSPHSLTAFGTDVTLSVHAVGLPPLSYQWFKGTAKVAAGNAAQIQLRNVQIKDAGAYRVEITSGSNTPVSSANVEVAVADVTAREVVLAGGGSTKLEVKAAGSGLLYSWLKDSTAVVGDARITGSDKNILNIGKPLGHEDSGLYQLVVSGPGGTLTTAGHKLSIFTEAPVITENPPVFAPAIVGGDFTPYTIPVDPDSKKAPTAFAAAGLPPGLKLDAKSGRITGKPTAVSKDPLGYLVKLTAFNSKGKSIVEGRLLVQALPENAIGSFAAPIGRHASLNAGLGGLLELTITKTAAFSGKLYLGATTLPVKGALVVTAAQGETASTQTGQQIILRKGLADLKLTFTLDAPNNKISSAQITVGEDTVEFAGWRNKWTKTTPATSAVGTYHTFALEIPATFVGDVRVPQGNGFGSFTVKPDGKLSVAGKLADGELLTQAGFVGPDGEIALFRTLYKTTPKGSVAGSLDINVPAITGTVTWSRPATPSVKHRLYQAGFPEVISLTAVGGQYVPPVAPKVFLDLNAGEAATLSIVGGGAEALVAQLTDLDLAAVILAKSKVTLPANATANPRKPTLTLTEKTGLFKGAFNLENNNPLPTGKPPIIKQAVKFEGIAIRGESGPRAAGYFLVQQLPSETVPLPASTAILSGQVTLVPAGQP